MYLRERLLKKTEEYLAVSRMGNVITGLVYESSRC